MQRPTTVLFKTFVVRPISAAHRVLGDAIWPPLEAVAGGMGALLGTVAQPLMKRRPQAHPLEPLLLLTNLVERSLGIEGTDEYGPGTVRRVVHRCPFAEHLQDCPEFCLRLGFIGGQRAFAKVVPAADYEITTTKSQGSSCCEYRYWLRDER